MSTPDPALRLAARLRWVLLSIAVLVSAGTWWTLVIHPAPAEVGPARFYCPMHPAITSPHAGSCPICGMNLEPIPDERLQVTAREEPVPTPDNSPPPLAPVMLGVERRQAIGVASEPVERASAARTVRMGAIATLPEDATTEVRLRVPGFVERVAPIVTGQRVAEGELLAEIYAADWTRAADELLATQRLARTSTLAAGALTLARARLLGLGVAARDVDALLKDGHAPHALPLRAPRGGVVIERSINAGGYAGPEQRLFAIAELSRLWLDAQLPAADAASLPVGLVGTWLPASGRGPRRARLVRVIPRAEPDTRTLIARFELSADPATLRPGEAGELALELPPEDHLLVPRDAIVDVGLARYVFVDRQDGAFEPRRVEIGALYGERRAVLSGLEAGERVVTRGLFLLDSESRLQAALRPRPLSMPDAGEAHP